MFLQNLSNTNVWETMEALRSRLDRLFYNTAAYSAGDFPPLNLWSSEEKVVVQALVPGAVAEDLDIHVSGQVMRISLSAPQCSEQGAMQQQERGACALTREVQLPYSVDAERVEATFRDGVLAVTLPRAQSDMPRKIAIKSAT